jgi:hypothetical protein
MKKLLSFLFITFYSINMMAQYAMNSQLSNSFSSDSKKETHKSKPIKYNSLGYQIPIDVNKDIIIGGSSLAYKRWGFCVTYRIGIKNFMMPDGESGSFTYDNVVNNKWQITGNTQRAVVGMMGGCLVLPITKKWPIYVGPGGTFYRQFFQYIDPFDKKPKWNDNPNYEGLQWNYTIGTVIPISSRILLNVEYNNNPQCIFVGIVITERFCYEDIDEW